MRSLCAYAFTQRSQTTTRRDTQLFTVKIYTPSQCFLQQTKLSLPRKSGIQDGYNIRLVCNGAYEPHDRCDHWGLARAHPRRYPTHRDPRSIGTRQRSESRDFGLGYGMWHRLLQLTTLVVQSANIMVSYSKSTIPSE
jgi:hypothetical protein